MGQTVWPTKPKIFAVGPYNSANLALRGPKVPGTKMQTSAPG